MGLEVSPNDTYGGFSNFVGKGASSVFPADLSTILRNVLLPVLVSSTPLNNSGNCCFNLGKSALVPNAFFARTGNPALFVGASSAICL